MSMDNYAYFADVILEKFVKEQCPDEFSNFMLALNEQDISFVDFVSDIYVEGNEDIEKYHTIFDALDALKIIFNLKTNLTLDLIYHSAEDRGDELDGAEFTVDGVYQLTPSGKKYQEYIERKNWTVYC